MTENDLKNTWIFWKFIQKIFIKKRVKENEEEFSTSLAIFVWLTQGFCSSLLHAYNKSGCHWKIEVSAHIIWCDFYSKINIYFDLPSEIVEITFSFNLIRFMRNVILSIYYPFMSKCQTDLIITSFCILLTLHSDRVLSLPRELFSFLWQKTSYRLKTISISNLTSAFQAWEGNRQTDICIYNIRKDLIWR